MEITRKNLVLKMCGYNITPTYNKDDKIYTYFDIIEVGFKEILISQKKEIYKLNYFDISRYNDEYQKLILTVNGIETKYFLSDILKINAKMKKAEIEKNIKVMYEKIKEIIIEIEKENFQITINIE